MKVGEFTLTTTAEGLVNIEGPKAYMEERGDDRLDSILAGTDVVFNAGMVHSPNIGTAVLVSLQTDYAAWKGARSL